MKAVQVELRKLSLIRCTYYHFLVFVMQFYCAFPPFCSSLPFIALPCSVYVIAPLTNVIEVRLGHTTDFFNKYQEDLDPSVCVSVVYGRPHQPDILSLLAFTDRQAEQFSTGLQTLMNTAETGMLASCYFFCK